MRRRLAVLLGALLVASAASGYELHELDLPVNDLEFDPVSGLVYASVKAVGPLGNHVAAIDPITRRVVRFVFVGSSPNRLAISDDGGTLYVGLDGSYEMRRVSLPDLTPGPLITFTPSDRYGPFLAHDIAVKPGDPDVIAVAITGRTESRGVRIFDGGVDLAAGITEPAGQIEFSEDPTILWAFNDSSGPELMRVRVDASGARVLAKAVGLVYAYRDEMLYDDGLLYFSVGALYDPSASKMLGHFEGSTYRGGEGLAVDAAHDRVYLLLRRSLEIFERTRFRKLGEIPFRNYEGFTVHNLTRFGDDGLVFSTSLGKLIFVDARLPDRDADGVGDPTDNCVVAANPDQRDGDFDGVGDVCDARSAQPDAGLRACRDSSWALEQELEACETEESLLDFDRDGEHDGRDQCPGTAAFTEVDDSGCSLAQYCAAMPLAICKDADWRNDEPKKPADCGLAGKKPNRVCQPL